MVSLLLVLSLLPLAWFFLLRDKGDKKKQCDRNISLSLPPKETTELEPKPTMAGEIFQPEQELSKPKVIYKTVSPDGIKLVFPKSSWEEQEFDNRESGHEDFKDAWEDIYHTGLKAFDALLPDVLTLSTPLKAHIEYIDREGNRSSRNIAISDFCQDIGQGLFRAFCEWRQANRTFRYANVQKFTDISTGEIIAIHDIPKYIFDIYSKSTKGQVEQYVAHNIDLVKLLITISRADGRLTAKERQIIVDFLQEFGSLPEALAESFDAEIKKRVSYLEFNSLHKFNKVLRQMVASQSIPCEKLYETLEKLVHTDKKMTTDEEKFLDWAKKILILNK